MPKKRSSVKMSKAASGDLSPEANLKNGGISVSGEDSNQSTNSSDTIISNCTKSPMIENNSNSNSNYSVDPAGNQSQNHNSNTSNTQGPPSQQSGPPQPDEYRTLSGQNPPNNGPVSAQHHNHSHSPHHPDLHHPGYHPQPPPHYSGYHTPANVSSVPSVPTPGGGPGPGGPPPGSYVNEMVPGRGGYGHMPLSPSSQGHMPPRGGSMGQRSGGNMPGGGPYLNMNSTGGNVPGPPPPQIGQRPGTHSGAQTPTLNQLLQTPNPLHKYPQQNNSYMEGSYCPPNSAPGGKPMEPGTQQQLQQPPPPPSPQHQQSQQQQQQQPSWNTMRPNSGPSSGPMGYPPPGGGGTGQPIGPGQPQPGQQSMYRHQHRYGQNYGPGMPPPSPQSRMAGHPGGPGPVPGPGPQGMYTGSSAPTQNSNPGYGNFNHHPGYSQPSNYNMMPPPSGYPSGKPVMNVSGAPNSPVGAQAAAQAALVAAANSANMRAPHHSYMKQHMAKMYPGQPGQMQQPHHMGNPMMGPPPMQQHPRTGDPSMPPPPGPGLPGSEPNSQLGPSNISGCLPPGSGSSQSASDSASSNSNNTSGASTLVTQSITSPLSTSTTSIDSKGGHSGPQPPPIVDEASQASTSSSQPEEGMDVPSKQNSKGPPTISHPPTPNTLGSPGAASMSSFHDEFESVSSPSWPRTPASPAINSQAYDHGHSSKVNKRPDGLLKLYEMSEEPERRAFLDKLISFNEERGVSLTSCPTISKQPLDLFKLYVLVKERGGFSEVTRQKLWKECAQICNIAISSSAAYTLRKQYIKHLLPYECKYDRGGIDHQLLITQTENANRKKGKGAPSPGPGDSNSQGSYPLSGTPGQVEGPYPPHIPPPGAGYPPGMQGYPPPPPPPPGMSGPDYSSSLHQGSFSHPVNSSGAQPHHSAQLPPTSASNHTTNNRGESISAQDPFSDEMQPASTYSHQRHPSGPPPPSQQSQPAPPSLTPGPAQGPSGSSHAGFNSYNTPNYAANAPPPGQYYNAHGPHHEQYSSETNAPASEYGSRPGPLPPPPPPPTSHGPSTQDSFSGSQPNANYSPGRGGPPPSVSGANQSYYSHQPYDYNRETRPYDHQRHAGHPQAPPSLQPQSAQQQQSQPLTPSMPSSQSQAQHQSRSQTPPQLHSQAQIQPQSQSQQHSQPQQQSQQQVPPQVPHQSQASAQSQSQQSQPQSSPSPQTASHQQQGLSQPQSSQNAPGATPTGTPSVPPSVSTTGPTQGPTHEQFGSDTTQPSEYGNRQGLPGAPPPPQNTSQESFTSNPPSSNNYGPSRGATPGPGAVPGQGYYNQQGYEYSRDNRGYEHHRSQDSVYSQQNLGPATPRGQFYPSGSTQHSQQPGVQPHPPSSMMGPGYHHPRGPVSGQQTPYPPLGQQPTPGTPEAYRTSEIGSYQNPMIRTQSALAQRLLAAKHTKPTQSQTGAYPGSGSSMYPPPNTTGANKMGPTTGGPTPTPPPSAMRDSAMYGQGSSYPMPKRHPDFIKQDQQQGYPINNYGHPQSHGGSQYPPYGGPNNRQTPPSTSPGSSGQMCYRDSYRYSGTAQGGPAPQYGPPNREAWDTMNSRSDASWGAVNRYGNGPTPATQGYVSASGEYYNYNSSSHHMNKVSSYGPRPNDPNRMFSSSPIPNTGPPNKPSHLPHLLSSKNSSSSQPCYPPNSAPLPPLGHHHHMPFQQTVKKEIVFPPDSVEAVQPALVKRRKLSAKDITQVEAWRLLMCLKSGLLAESTWALDILSILVHDDSTVLYFGLQHLPGLLDVLLEHYKKYLSESFEGIFKDVETPELSDVNGNSVRMQRREKKWYEIDKDLIDEAEKAAEEEANSKSCLKSTNRLMVNIPKIDEQLVLLNSVNYTYRSRDGKPVRVKNGKNLFVIDSEKKWDTFNEKNTVYTQHWAKGFGDCTSHIQTHFQPKEKFLRFTRVLKPKTQQNGSAVIENGSANEKEKSKLHSMNINCRKDCSVPSSPSPSSSLSSEITGSAAEKTSEPMSRKSDEIEDGVPRFRTAPTKRKNIEDLEEEAYNRDSPPLCTVDDYCDALSRRCLCLSTMIRNLSFVPGNDVEMSKHSGLLLILGRLILLNHEHSAKRRNFDKVNADELFNLAEDRSEDKIDDNNNATEKEWWWDTLHLIRENTLVTLANISGQLDLSPYPEQISFQIVDGLLHWAVCPSSYAQDNLPTSSLSTLSPQRMSLEALVKLSILENNVDLMLATPPWERLNRLYKMLAKLLSRNEDQTLREFSLVLLVNFAAADTSIARAIALAGNAVPQLISFVEQSEQSALSVANSQGINALRENPELMGTTLDMVRRAAACLRCLARIPENRPLFLNYQQRLLALVMSQILDQGVASIIADVIYECSLYEHDLSLNSLSSSNSVTETDKNSNLSVKKEAEESEKSSKAEGTEAVKETTTTTACSKEENSISELTSETSKSEPAEEVNNSSS